MPDGSFIQGISAHFFQMDQVRDDPCKETCYVGADPVLLQHAVQDPVQLRVMHMVHMREKVMGDMVVKSPEYEIGCLAEGIKIV